MVGFYEQTFPMQSSVRQKANLSLYFTCFIQKVGLLSLISVIFGCMLQ